MSIDTQTERAPADKPFILVREDRDLSLSYYFSSYLESTTSQHIYYKGKVYVGLKLYEPTARRNALWQGWYCITEGFYLEPKKEAEEKAEIKIDPTPAKKKRSPRKKK